MPRRLRIRMLGAAVVALSAWLPAPADNFNLTLRMYSPKDKTPSITDGSWAPPAVTLVSK
jgi:hypothetical protein